MPRVHKYLSDHSLPFCHKLVNLVAETILPGGTLNKQMVNLHFLARILWDLTFESLHTSTAKLESKWEHYVLTKERTSHKETAHMIDETNIVYEKECASARPAFVIYATEPSGEEKTELMHLYWSMGLRKQHGSQATLL